MKLRELLQKTGVEVKNPSDPKLDLDLIIDISEFVGDDWLNDNEINATKISEVVILDKSILINPYEGWEILPLNNL